MLDVSAIPDGLRFTVSERRQSALNTLALVAEQDVDMGKLQCLHTEVVEALNRANQRGGMDPQSLDILRRRGQLLFDELVPPLVKRRIRETELRDLVLLLDESLVFLPWELMHTGRGFLALLFNTGRMVRSQRPASGVPRTLGPRGAARLLVLCDPRSDLMAAYNEGLTLRDELDQHAPFLDVALYSSEVGVSDVRATLRDFDIVHFAGHAESGSDPATGGGWKLQDGVFGPREIVRMSGGAALPALVFANACASGRVNAPLAHEDSELQVYSLAQAFLLGGVQHYVGTLWDVPDESAGTFALAFYRALIRGESIGRCLVAARGELISRLGIENVVWASYVLYGDPTASLIQPGMIGGQAGADVVHLPPPPPHSGSRTASSARAARLAHLPAPGADGARAASDRASRAAASSAAAPRAVRVRSARLADAAAPALPNWAAAAARAVPWAWGVALTLGFLVAAFAWLRGSWDQTERMVRIADAPPTVPMVSRGAPGQGAAALGALPRAAVEIRAQGLDARGQSVVRTVEDGGHVPLGANFRLVTTLSQPAYLVVWHLSERGELDEVLRLAPEDWKRLRGDHEIVMPDAESWYFTEGAPGLHTFIAAASDSEPRDLVALTVDIVDIQRGVLLESPAYRVQAGPRVSLSDGRRDDRVEVTYMPVDNVRLQQALSSRVRKSMDTVTVSSFYAR